MFLFVQPSVCYSTSHFFIPLHSFTPLVCQESPSHSSPATTPHYTTPHPTTPHYTALHHTKLTPHHTTPNHTTLHPTRPHHTTPHYTPPHHTTPHQATPNYQPSPNPSLIIYPHFRLQQQVILFRWENYTAILFIMLFTIF